MSYTSEGSFIKLLLAILYLGMNRANVDILTLNFMRKAADKTGMATATSISKLVFAFIS